MVYYFCNALDMQTNAQLFRAAAQNNDRYFSAREVLLIADSPVCSMQQMKPACPDTSQGPGAFHDQTGSTSGRGGIGAGSRKLRATNSRTASICSRVTSNCSMTSAMLKSSRFSNTVATGIGCCETPIRRCACRGRSRPRRIVTSPGLLFPFGCAPSYRVRRSERSG